MAIALAYGREHKARRVWRRYRLHFAVTGAILIAVAIYSQRNLFLHPLGRVYWQGQLVRPGPAAVVYIDKPPGSASSIRRNQTSLLPSHWQGFVEVGLSPPDPVVYVGLRNSRIGRDRLVVVTRKQLKPSPYSVSPVEFCAYVYDPAELGARAKQVWKGTPVVASVYEYQPLRVYAGQPDESLSDTFHIEYSSGMEKLSVTGVLKADDTVVLNVPPLPPPQKPQNASAILRDQLREMGLQLPTTRPRIIGLERDVAVRDVAPAAGRLSVVVLPTTRPGKNHRPGATINDIIRGPGFANAPDPR